MQISNITTKIDSLESLQECLEDLNGSLRRILKAEVRVVV